jgi:hypothetical protein
MAPQRSAKWEVRFTREAAESFNSLPAKDAQRIAETVDRVQLEGPVLRRPPVGYIRDRVTTT